MSKVLRLKNLAVPPLRSAPLATHNRLQSYWFAQILLATYNWAVCCGERMLRGNTSSSMAYCEVPYEEGWTKGTNCNSWYFRP
jgi:hypothetical protein